MKKEVYESKLEHFKRAINTLNYALVESKKKEKKDEELFSIFRDSVIQRFEYSYELSWKIMKYLGKYEESIEIRTPAQAIKNSI